LFGFSQRGSNKIVDLKECPVLLPTIEKSIPSLRQLAAIVSPRRGTMKLSVIACSNGLDIAASNGVFTAEPARSKAASLAIAEGWARLTLNGETLIETQRPLLACGIALVTPPPQAFVQAVAAAEEAMAQLVCGHLAGARHCADLFSGFGAFALRLAVNSTVLAVESSAPALAALDRAWRETGGRLKAVSTLRRDLFSAPLTAAEMKKIDGVVFDPPRAGAEAQAHEIARSAVPLVAAVSCNPVTLARDLKILHDGGYRIERVTPLDQFTHTPHVEAVALLRRQAVSA
jgi:23S rRNA (uracil1939-C5)-methyltransferase